MSKLANYKILHGLRMILECCKGNATIEDAIEMKKCEIKDRYYDPGYNILVDFREFTSSIDSSSLLSLSVFVDFLKGLRLACKVALLTTKPHQVVVMNMVKNLSIDSKMEFEIFSTLEASVSFVDCPEENLEIIDGYLQELSLGTCDPEC